MIAGFGMESGELGPDEPITFLYDSGEIVADFDVTIEVPVMEGPEASIEGTPEEFNPLDFVDMERWTRYQEEKRVLAERLATEANLQIGNGFSFVIDRRPSGQENRPIPPHEYTRYFSEGSVPVAPLGHREHEHDLTHAPSYKKMLEEAEGVARLVRTAAINALGDPKLSKVFTDAMDGFGDCHRNILQGSVPADSTTGLTHYLGDLINLAYPELSGEDATSQKAALNAELVVQLDLAA
jgi:hypothetical protein